MKYCINASYSCFSFSACPADSLFHSSHGAINAPGTGFERIIAASPGTAMSVSYYKSPNPANIILKTHGQRNNPQRIMSMLILHLLFTYLNSITLTGHSAAHFPQPTHYFVNERINPHKDFYSRQSAYFYTASAGVRLCFFLFRFRRISSPSVFLQYTVFGEIFL